MLKELFGTDKPIIGVIHLLPLPGSPRYGGELETVMLPGERDLNVLEHRQLMEDAPSCEDQLLQQAAVSGPLSFYYGLCPGDLALVKMFAQPERVRLAYSPSGAGQGMAGLPGQPAARSAARPARSCLNPAWDYVLHQEDVAVGEAYTWDICMAIKPYAGRADVLREVERFQGLPR